MKHNPLLSSYIFSFLTDIGGNNAVVDGTDVDGADVNGTDVDGTDVNGTDIDGTDVNGTDVDGIDVGGSNEDGSILWSKFEGHSYTLLPGYNNNAQCRADCLRLGADLASIHSQRENDFLEALIKTRPVRDGMKVRIQLYFKSFSSKNLTIP